MKFDNEIELTECDGGLLVRQGDEAYIAQKWRLSAATVELVTSCIDAGLSWMIREGHPRADARWPNPRGVVNLAFSPTPTDQWSVAIDSLKNDGTDYRRAVFNGKYRTQFEQRGISFQFEGRNRKVGHLIVKKEFVIDVINQVRDFDHSVLVLNRRSSSENGFRTEYDIQKQLLLNWSDTLLAEFGDIYKDEYPVDGGLNSRRIDILAFERKTGAWLAVELKRAEATSDAVHQAISYRNALAGDDTFLTGEVRAALVAERIPQGVRALAAMNNVIAFEIEFPARLRRVA